MKCIKCETDNILTDRTGNGGRCKTCNHPFVFEPTTMKGVKITDPKFKKAIEDVSANNTLFFTPTQFAYFLDGRLRRSPRVSSETYGGHIAGYIVFSMLGALLGILATNVFKTMIGFVFVNLIIQALVIFVFFRSSTDKTKDNRGRRRNARSLRNLGIFLLGASGVILFFIMPSFPLFATIVFMGLGSIYLGNRQLAQPPSGQEFLFSNRDFQGWLQRWKELNREVPKLLPSPREQLASASINPDVTAYSFDRLVVCDRAEIAHLLIANNFHFENNCAVLSITGYPESIFDTTMQMLHRNPNLKVYVVHDCNPKGMGLVQRLRSSDRWFKGRNVLMIDIGVTPRQVLSAKGMFIQTSAESAKDAAQSDRSQWQGLAPNEIKWLEAGNYVELESFTPQQLIQVINRGIAGSRDLSYDDGYSGSDGFISSSDSFG
jgi:hypothetical protein